MDVSEGKAVFCCADLGGSNSGGSHFENCEDGCTTQNQSQGHPPQLRPGHVEIHPCPPALPAASIRMLSRFQTVKLAQPAAPTRGKCLGGAFSSYPFKKTSRQETGAAADTSLSAMTATLNCTSRMLVPRVDVGQRAVPPYGRKRISLFLSAAPCSTRRLWSAAELQAQGMGETVHGQSDSVRPPSDHAQVCLALALSLSNRESESRKRPRPPSEKFSTGLLNWASVDSGGNQRGKGILSSGSTQRSILRLFFRVGGSKWSLICAATTKLPSRSPAR